MEETFLVTLHMGSPIIMEILPCFDGILAWPAVQEAGLTGNAPDYDAIHDALPLRKRFLNGDKGDYVYEASTLFVKPDDIVASALVHVTKRFPVEEAAMYVREHTAKINLSSGPNRNYRIAFPAKSINQVHFLFTGDGDAVEKLLSKWLHGLGKKTAIGYGVINQIDIRPDSAANPLVFPDGEARRPIPVYAAEALGVTKGLDRTAMVSHRPPYSPWHPERRTECVVPRDSRLLGGVQWR